MNRHEFLDRRAGGELGVVTASPLHFATRTDRFNRQDGRRPTLREMERLAYPALRAVLRSGRGSDDLRGGVALALGKTGDFEVLDILEALTFKRPGWKAGRLTRESVALAFGLMPRVDDEDRARIAKNCLRIFDDDERPARERAWAVIALGLAADVKSTEALVARFDKSYRKPVLKAALAAAIGLTGDIRARAVLEDAVSKRGLHDTIRAFACYGLGKLGDPAAAPLLLQVANGRRFGRVTKRAAIVALGNLLPHASTEQQTEAVKLLTRIVRRKEGVFVTGHALVALGRLGTSDAIDLLVKTAKGGNASQRRFAVLGLASSVARDRVPGEIRNEIVAELAVFARRAKNAETRSVCLLARGMVRDKDAADALHAVARKKGSNSMVRGFACLALGLIGKADPKTTGLLHAALTDTNNPELRERAAAALGLLRDSRATAILLEHLDKAKSYAETARVVRALGRVGDHRAIGPLVRILADKSRSDVARALAAVGIGLIGDPTDPPRLHHFVRDYPIGLTAPALDELLAIH